MRRSQSERSCYQRHQDDEGDLADVGRFSRHVPSGDDGEAQFVGAKIGVVRHNFLQPNFDRGRGGVRASDGAGASDPAPRRQ